jgi:hypothetical protein
MAESEKKYNPTMTAIKGAVPIGVAVTCEFAYFVLKMSGHEVQKDLIYQVALAGYGGIAALINYFKNHKKK